MTRTTQALLGVFGLVLVGAIAFLSFTHTSRTEVVEEVQILRQEVQDAKYAKADAMSDEFKLVRREFAAADAALSERLSGVEGGLKSANIRIRKAREEAGNALASVINLEGALARKADAEAVEDALAAKADVAALATKADSEAVEANFALKADVDALARRLAGIEPRVSALE
ncbi:MAG: hypothetical protein A3J93_02040 [Candidatus Magasanikbacteria bacterium RIFOXYC2_FULL_42_28]|uniref:Uncharacterized protein n=1 Tax=Candidatus Magasanikbacteria bacterium RIFOXYC2_FULL_42_28 TaxID=1798704 RepID=A0A1F6NWN5_9BACT|nr:MAG: hypothetical protein A3J93_02040 [Candidatus Magasanikbacteria bacterium RIFOXYC2_FULL_42_28]